MFRLRPGLSCRIADALTLVTLQSQARAIGDGPRCCRTLLTEVTPRALVVEAHQDVRVIMRDVASLLTYYCGTFYCGTFLTELTSLARGESR